MAEENQKFLSIHFDIGYRIEGDMVNQLQAHFFASYFYFDGTLSGESRDMASFWSLYFPEPKPQAAASTSAKLLSNIPWVQHRATEAYYQRVRQANSKVTLVNEFLSEPAFDASMMVHFRKRFDLSTITAIQDKLDQSSATLTEASAEETPSESADDDNDSSGDSGSCLYRLRDPVSGKGSFCHSCCRARRFHRLPA